MEARIFSFLVVKSEMGLNLLLLLNYICCILRKTDYYVLHFFSMCLQHWDFLSPQALADAIRSVTEFNPDMSVERIECVQQIEDVKNGN